ncbi:hypothetical protein ACJIZ3_020971 [Penstemon smallii]|uniref:Uncharacterized protein n=1 Tax=Penstemon smallii TaxID=265156 RepID=A0ABD3SK48_9LAMI
MGLWISRVHVAIRRISCLVEFSCGIFDCLKLLFRIILDGAAFLFVQPTWVSSNDFHDCAAAFVIIILFFSLEQLLRGSRRCYNIVSFFIANQNILLCCLFVVGGDQGVLLLSADLGIICSFCLL